MKHFLLMTALLGFASVSLHANTLATSLRTNPGAETGTMSRWTIGSPETPRVNDGNFERGINPHSGNFDFTGGTSLPQWINSPSPINLHSHKSTQHYPK
jgi:hypothetical protein